MRVKIIIKVKGTLLEFSIVCESVGQEISADCLECDDNFDV